MKQRVSKLKRLLKRHKLDALLISRPSNIYYISGFTGSDSYSLITSGQNYIITDFRYREQAHKEAKGFEVITKPVGLLRKATNLLKSLSLKKTGFESDHLTVRESQVIASALKKKLLPTSQLIEKLRIVKEPEEIEAIKESASIARNVLKIIIKEIKPGCREKDIAAKADFLLRKKGADRPAFETIVASGPNASMPHARPRTRRIRPSEPIIIDFGANFRGYNSDLTRTHFVGRIEKHFKLIHSIVADAQSKAIDRVTPGKRISEIDKIARDYITKKGFGSYFGHATGHGIGIDIHEWPDINSRNHAILREGMVFSVEPGIYIPGQGGIRIEDMVLVTKKGHRVLTR